NDVNGAGESYLVFGTSNPSSSIELSSLNGSNGFVLNGMDGGDDSGFSVSSAGDFNGDGLDDVIIGAPDADGSSGESYVIFGTSNPSSSIELSNLDGSNGFVLNGMDGGDDSGFSVSSAGDINGDELADLIIGANFADPNGSLSGESYVVFGTSNPSSSIELSNLDGSNGFVLNGINERDYSGRSVSSAGDFNGDGLADIITGAYKADPNRVDRAGESYIVFGRDFNTDENTAFTTSSVLANDTDPNEDTLSITAIDTTGTLGIVTNNGDGTFNYDPNGQFDSLNDKESATDTFSCIISDGNLTDTGTVTIAIAGVNDPPIANDDSFNTDEDTPFTTGSALANDTDPEGDSLTITAIDTTGTLGIVTNNGDGTFDYDPNGQFDSLNDGESATDTFSYTISDGNLTDTGTVTIAIATNQVINGTNLDDTVIGGAGKDTLYGLDGNDLLLGQDNDDRLIGGNGNDVLNGEAGADILLGRNNHDTLNGGIGADVLYGQEDDDYLNGNEGNDTLYGGIGADVLYGQEDNDRLIGEDGNDTLDGGIGADILLGRNNDDSLIGGHGNDLLNGEAGADILLGQNGNDTLYGDIGDDILYGQEDNDRLIGNKGSDTIYGGIGADFIYGKNGDDSLIGGLGLDTLKGGPDNDRFVLASGLTGDRDIIQDFEDGIDILELSGGLSFGSLTITQNGTDTDIIETATSQTLATLTDITATNINELDFA
ncbi:VCBS repeat-containing protein, partial [Xenococcus sp. PCC 7305]|uniref:Ig-like domain-containing protein n=1 Tax=Xenococcus sp. PCC 7305 TaxID=102125 RepID=UPI0002ACBE5C